jgi:hypothetical protein
MGAYAPSKLFQILSTYKLKNILFGKISIKFSKTKISFKMKE